jgi:hypothetical protein
VNWLTERIPAVHLEAKERLVFPFSSGKIRNFMILSTILPDRGLIIALGEANKKKEAAPD